MIADLLYGWDELKKAEPGYTMAREMYEGTYSEHFTSRTIAEALGDSGDAYRMNLIATAVDVLANRLEIRKVVAPDQEELTSWIAQAWEANDMDVHYPDAILKACEYGDSYLMVWPVIDEEVDDESTASLVDDALVKAGVEFVVHNPCNSRLFYDEENERRKAFFLKRWEITLPNEEKARWRVDLWYPNHVEHWISRRDQQPDKAAGWEPYDDPELGSSVEDNPFGEIPFFHYRTALPYGEPVHKRGYGAQNAITKMHITQITSSEAQGFKQRYGLINADAVLDAASDGADYLADDDANATSTDVYSSKGGKGSNIRTGPGTLQLLEGLDEVGTFDEAEPAVFLDPAEVYEGALAVLTQTPFHDFKPSSQPPSGESRRIAEVPLVKRAAKLQKMLKAPVVETWQFALKASGRKVVPLRVSWTPPYAADGVDDWQMVQSKQTAGVAQHVTLTEAGYEADEVTRWLDDDPEQMSIAKRAELFGIVAAAAQNLGLAGLLGGMPGMGGAGPGGGPSSGGGAPSGNGAPAPALPPADPAFKAMILELLTKITTATEVQP